jgi:hypothetical protein
MSSCVTSTVVVVVFLTVFVFAITWSVCDAAPTLLPARHPRNDSVTAVVDPDSRAHGTNESLHLGDFAASCLAEILMLDAIAQLDPEGKT